MWRSVVVPLQRAKGASALLYLSLLLPSFPLLRPPLRSLLSFAEIRVPCVIRGSALRRYFAFRCCISERSSRVNEWCFFFAVNLSREKRASYPLYHV